ncbi:MAG: hypothetical protein ABFS21_02980 [Actinomycetota bacterium]
MSSERSNPAKTPRRGIARFLRGDVTDRFLGGVGFSAAAMPITGEGNIGDLVTRVTDTIPAFTREISPMTTTIPDETANFGRFVSGRITELLAVSPTVTPPPFG